MMTPRPRAVAHLYQGNREPLRATVCLICRLPVPAFGEERARRIFAETGICQACHTAIDAWIAEGTAPAA